MKAQVIFYSALAFLFNLVASIPYAVDLQRYSSLYQTRPSLESTNPQRPYQNLGQRPNGPYNGVYSNPAPQFQEQKLPKINQDSYFPRNQQIFLNKGPPQIQPEVSNERYINQQKIPNQYYANNFKEPILHSQNDNWKGAHGQINENQPKVGYPEVQERDSSYHYYSQQGIQNNRYPQNFRNGVRETLSLAENTYPEQSIPTSYNGNRGFVGNSPLHEERPPHQTSPIKPNNEPLSIDSIQQPNSVPEVFNEESFVPSIPSIPTRNIYLGSDVLKRVDDHYLQIEPVEEHQIPIVPSQPNHVENGAPISASERQLARAGNPVEQNAEPQVQSKPNLEHIFSHSRIQNVLSTTKHKKRYLVIHPNGKIEHVDSLETIAKQHPNYVLVNAGDIVPNTARQENKDKEYIVPTPAKPVPENDKITNEHAILINKTYPTFTYEPSNFEVEMIVKKPSIHVPEALSTTTPVILTPTSTSGSVSSTNAPATIVQTTPTAPVISPQAVAVASDPHASAIASAPYATAIASSHQAATAVPTSQAPPSLLEQSTPPTPQAQSTNSTLIDPYARVVTTTSRSQAQTATPVSLPQSAESTPLETSATAPSPSSPKNLQSTKTEIEKEVLPPNSHTDTESAVKEPNNVPETTSIIATESTSLNVTSTETPPAVPASSEKTTPNSIPVAESSQSSTPNIVNVTSTLAPATKYTLQSDETIVTGVEMKDQPQIATTGSDNSTEGPLVVPVIYNPNNETSNNIDKFILNEASNNIVPNPDEKVPDLGDSDIVANVPHNPVVWFRTSDPNFWHKLTDKTTGFDVIYFFQIHNQPKIVHDSKTTVFPNGTILEEFTETSWDFEGAEPKVTKTTKLTNPEDL